MYLTGTVETLQVILAGAVTTNDSVVTVDYGDNTATTFTAGKQRAVTNGVTAVDILAAPAASTQRIVQFLTMTNQDTAPITVTIRTNNAGTLAPQFGPVTLQVGERVQFATDTGFTVYTVTGAEKVTAVASTVEPGYIDGSKLIWNSATSITIDSGSFYIPSVGANINVPAAITKAGLALSANTWYHVYGFLNAGVPDFEIVTTAPSSPYNGTARTKTGDTTRRYIGSIRAGAGGSVLQFQQSGNYVGYLYDSVGTGRMLSAGTATVVTAVSLASVIPVTSRIGQLNITNGTAANSMFTRSPDQPLAGGVAGPFLFMALRAASFASVAHPLSSAQAVEYYFNAAPPSDGGYIDVVGYLYER